MWKEKEITMSKDWKLSLIDKDLLYKVLSVPSFTGMEDRMRDFLLDYAKNHNYEVSVDDKGNVYMVKGELKDGEYYPCLVAHMDTVQERQIPYIEKDLPVPLETDDIDGLHMIYGDGYGIGGDDKAGIAVALAIMKLIPACKAVFFVEEEIGCCGSSEVELKWFKDVGYILAFDSPGCNCSSWSCNGNRLFDRKFYEDYLVELDEKFGPMTYFAHPYTDVMVLRENTSLACMNIGAGYYDQHTLYEYVIAEEVDRAVAIGMHLIDRLGMKEYVLPFISSLNPSDDPDYYYFAEKFGK